MSGRKRAFRLLALAFILLPLAASACVPRERQPLSFDDQQALVANRQCRDEATQMNREWRGDTSYFPWRAYYDMCMKRFDVTNEQMRRLGLP